MINLILSKLFFGKIKYMSIERDTIFYMPFNEGETTPTWQHSLLILVRLIADEYIPTSILWLISEGGRPLSFFLTSRLYHLSNCFLHDVHSYVLIITKPLVFDIKLIIFHQHIIFHDSLHCWSIHNRCRCYTSCTQNERLLVLLIILHLTRLKWHNQGVTYHLYRHLLSQIITCGQNFLPHNWIHVSHVHY